MDKQIQTHQKTTNSTPNPRMHMEYSDCRCHLVSNQRRCQQTVIHLFQWIVDWFHIASGNTFNNRTPNTWFPKRFFGLRYYDTPIFRPIWPFMVGGTHPQFLPSSRISWDFCLGKWWRWTELMNSRYYVMGSIEDTECYDEFRAVLQWSSTPEM